MPGLSDVTALSAGGSHVLALRTDGSVWAYALEVDGQGSETLAEAVRRARTYQIVMPVMGFVAAPIAVVLFRMNLDKWKDERHSRIRAATTPC